LLDMQVNHFIEHLEDKDTLEPKGYEGQAGPAEAAAAAEKARAKKAAAAAAAAAKREAAAAPLPKPPGRVIVVGAGPAGLAAATVLKVNTAALLAQQFGRCHMSAGCYTLHQPVHCVLSVRC
jgi:hypothetical protein